MSLKIIQNGRPTMVTLYKTGKATRPKGVENTLPASSLQSKYIFGLV